MGFASAHAHARLRALLFTRLSFLSNVNSRSLYAVSRPSVVCRLSSSLTLVQTTQAVAIFGNFSTSFGTLAIVILDLSKPISLKRCNIGSKLVLITNRKSHMSFRLVPKSVTLNNLEWHNGRYFALFQRIR